MTIENSDYLLVNKGGESFKIKYETIKDNVIDGVVSLPEAPVDGKQYGRQNATWTEVVNTGGGGTSYTDSNVDAHLNLNQADGGQVLSWDGTDYKWVNDQTSGGGGSSDPNLTTYTYPSGQARSLQSRLEDYRSVKDFGAVGDGVTDDTVAVTAALKTTGATYFPTGTYRITSKITTGYGVRIFGDGLESIIYNDHDGDCIVLAYSSSIYAPEDQFSISDMVIACAPGRVAGAGLTLLYTGPPTLVGAYDKLYINNLDIISYNGPNGPTGYFQKGFVMINSAGAVANNLNISTNSMDGASENSPATNGIEIFNSLAGHAMIRTLTVDQFYIQRYYNPLIINSASSGSIESIYISKGEVLGYNGFVVNAGAAMTFTDIHFDCLYQPIVLRSSSGTIRITGCDIRSYRGNGYGGWAIELNTPATTFTGNFVLAFKSANGAILCSGTVCEDTVITGNVIHGNFSPSATAVYSANGATNIVFGGNCIAQWGGAASPWGNDGNSELYVFGQRGART
jgi:hypothetical protein